MKMLYRVLTNLWNIVSLRDVNIEIRLRYGFFLTWKKTSWLEAVYGNTVAVVATEFPSYLRSRTRLIMTGTRRGTALFSADSTISVTSSTFPGIWNALLRPLQ